MPSPRKKPADIIDIHQERETHGGIRLADALARWQAFRSGPPRPWARGTKATARTVAGRLLDVLGDLPLKALSTGDVERFFVHLGELGLHGTTIDRDRAIFLSFWRWASLHGFVDASLSAPNAWPRIGAEGKRELLVLTHKEEALLLPELRSIDRRATTFLLYQGLRIGELWEAKVSWLKADETPGNWLLGIPVEKRKQRRTHWMPLHPRALEQALPLGEPDSPLIAALPPQTSYRRRLRAAARRARINPALKPHDLRRTWCTRLLNLGVPEASVQKLGGWGSLPVMIEHYHKQRLDEARAFLERLK